MPGRRGILTKPRPDIPLRRTLRLNQILVYRGYRDSQARVQEALCEEAASQALCGPGDLAAAAPRTHRVGRGAHRRSRSSAVFVGVLLDRIAALEELVRERQAVVRADLPC
jgi:hypothetical protein